MEGVIFLVIVLAIGGQLISKFSRTQRKAGMQMAADELGLRVHGKGLGGDMNGYIVAVDHIKQGDKKSTRFRVAYPEWLGFNLRVATDQLGELRKIPLFGQVMPAQDIEIGQEWLDTKHLIQGDEIEVVRWFTPRKVDMVDRAAKSFSQIEITDRRVEAHLNRHITDPEEVARRVRAVVFMAEVASMPEETAPAGSDPFRADYRSGPKKAKPTVVDVEMDQPEPTQPLTTFLDKQPEPTTRAEAELPVLEPIAELPDLQSRAEPYEMEAYEGEPYSREPLAQSQVYFPPEPGPDLYAESDIASVELPPPPSATSSYLGGSQSSTAEPESMAVPIATPEAQAVPEANEVAPTPSAEDPADDPAGAETVAKPVAELESAESDASPEQSTAIEELAGRLFGEYIAAYEIETRFDETVKGSIVTWSGTLQSVGEYRRDRRLGDGPGTELELKVLEFDDGREILVFAALPENLEIDHMRTGGSITVKGTLSSVDAIMRRFYLTEAELV